MGHLIHLIKLAFEHDEFLCIRLRKVKDVGLKLFKSICNFKEVFLLQEEVEVLLLRFLYDGFDGEKEGVLF